MNLRGDIHAAFLAAFNYDELKILVFDDLGENLEIYSLGGNFEVVVSDLIEGCVRKDQLKQLLKAAVQRRPKIPTFAALLARLEGGEVVQPTILGKAEIKDVESLPPELGDPPYLGLQYFDEKDAGHFFGRELLTARLVNRLVPQQAGEQNSFLAVIGASGSGKSSLVRAGVVPALRRGERLADGSIPPVDSPRWLIRVLTPTAHPLEALAASLVKDATSASAVSALEQELNAQPAALAKAAQSLLLQESSPRLLLVIDQFEEVFTQCYHEEERQAFIAGLLAAVDPQESRQVSVLLLLRADFYARLAQYDRLRERVAQNQEFIGAMSREELTRAIVQPAALGNWKIQEGLVDVILDDIGSEPGALPLLSHALLETWKRNHGRVMTLSGYNEAGGVRGAIAQTAETVFRQRLSPAQQVIARMIFIRLAELGDDAQDSRRRAAFSELITRSTDPLTIDAVLSILTDARLVITDTLEPGDVKVVEVAHEALIREWPTLRQWLNENREGLVLHRELADDTNRWQRLGRDPGALYRGVQLKKAVDWSAQNQNMLSLNEQEFLEASQNVEKEEAKVAEIVRRTALLRRLVFPAVGVGVIGILVVAFFVSGLNYLFRTPARMSGAFSVAVAEFGLIGADGSVTQAPGGSGDTLSGWAADQLKAQLPETLNIQVWRDGSELRPLNVHIGRVEGKTPAERGAAAQAMAERLNAQMVLYGNIDASQQPARLVIEAWFTPQPYYHFEDIQGSQQTGAPILLADPSKPGLEAQPEVRDQASAFAWLAIGLTNMRFGQTETALDNFKKAAEFAPQSAAVQFFVGEESLFRSDSDLAHQHTLTQAAEDAFHKALALDPQYVRANVGLGGVYFARAKRLVAAVQGGESADQAFKDRQEAGKQLDLAMDAYNQALHAPAAQQPTGVPVGLAARLGIGTSLRLRGEILQRSSQNDQAVQALQQSVQELEAIIQPLQQAKQERYLAQTYQALGTAYQYLGYMAQLKKDPAQSKTEYTGAVKYYDLCTSLGGQSLDLIVKNDIAGKLCAPFRKEVQGQLDALSGGS